MKPIKKTRVSEMVIERIEEMIEERSLQPGDKLPSENVLSKNLEVSRSSVREAIRILEIRGRVKVMQGKGAFLAGSAGEWFELNRDSIEELFEVRALVESHAAAKCAKCVTEDDMAEFRKLHDEYVRALEAGNIVSAIQLDKDFHSMISKLSGNEALKGIMGTIVSALSDGWICSLQIPVRRKATVGEHEDIIQALESRDAKRASVLMKTHLQEALRDIKAYYKKGEQS